MSKENWDRYAETWSLPLAERHSRLAEVATADVTYTDPNTSLAGPEALSEYMGGFQDSLPGGRFVITEVFEHHGQSLAHWQLVGPDNAVIHPGTSHARLAGDGRFVSFTGFFPGAGD